MKRMLRPEVLSSAMVVVFAFAAAASVGPPAGWVDRRSEVCGIPLPIEDCRGGPVPIAWDEAPAIWFVLAFTVTLVVAVALWLAPVRDGPVE
jgi:hypothetical protein